MALIMHTPMPNKNVFKAQIAAEYSGVKIELVNNFKMGVTNKSPEFLAMNPIGKVPVLETPDGPIFESNAIARYVARLKECNPLLGTSTMEYALIEQWIDFTSNEIDAHIIRWYYPRLGMGLYVPAVEEFSIQMLKRGLGALNTHLEGKTFLVGSSITLADIVAISNLWFGFRKILTKSFTCEFPNVERYVWAMVEEPNFSKYLIQLGELKQVDCVPPLVKRD